jgi:hypothetical protein
VNSSQTGTAIPETPSYRGNLTIQLPSVEPCMSKVQTETFTEPDEIAAHILEEFAAENSGVAEVIPAARIRSHLDEVVADAPALDEAEYDDLYVDVKDAVLEHDVIIA